MTDSTKHDRDRTRVGQRRPLERFARFCLLSLLGCSGLFGCSAPVTRDLDTPALIWPLPPAPPRFELEPPLIALEIPTGFFGRLGRAILGSPQGLKLDRPTGLSFTPSGDLAFVDQGVNRVYVCDLNGRIEREIDLGRAGIEEAVDVVVDSTGALYVTDPRRGRVVRFDPKDDEAWTEIEIGGRPTSIAFDRTRDAIVVVDTLTPAIVTIDRTTFTLLPGAPATDGPPLWNRPVWVTPSSAGGVWVVDALNFRVCRVEGAGAVAACFGRLGDGPGTFARPRGVAEDDAGRVYVVDALFGNCQVFDEAGQLLLAIGSRGSGAGEMLLPSDIAIDGDTIAITDSYNRRIQIFRRLPPPAPAAAVAARSNEEREGQVP